MNDRKEIGIFELAELFGITPAAIRKYEGKGIIQPERNIDNKYRKYSSWEVVKMVFARGLSQEGFSLSQVSQMLETQEPVEHIEPIEVLQAELAKEIVYKKRLITLLDRQKRSYESRKTQGKVQIECLPALYCCRLLEENELACKSNAERKKLEEWIEALPFVSVYIIHTESHECRTCLGISEEERKSYGLEQLVPDFVLPEKMCVTCNVVFDREGWYERGEIDEGFEQAKSLGFPIESTSIMRMYAYVQHDGKYTCHVKGCFPILV